MVYANHGIIVRVIYLVVACARWVLTGGGRFGRGRVAVLCFHGITASQRDRFGRMVRHVSRRAISTESLDLEHPRGVPRVCLTFDDAFANLLDNALPTLQEFKVPGTVFAVSGNLGCAPKWEMPEGHHDSSEPTMTRQQLQGSVGETIRVGSHTRSHPSLTRLDARSLRAELEDSKKALETAMGVRVEELAFPYGAYDSAVVKAAADAGYSSLFSLDPVLHTRGVDVGVIGRFSVDPDMWFVEFMLTCDGAYTWLDRFRQFIQRLRRTTNEPRSRLSTGSV